MMTRPHLIPALALSMAIAWLASNADAAAASTEFGRIDVSRSASQLLDQETLASVADVLGANEIVNWKMYVPDTYDPSRPAGLFVYISPSPKGYMPRGWQAVFDDENLIWISADNSGNDTPSVLRMLYAVLAPRIVSESYEIDADRVYLSGFSGGGKMASMVSVHFANVFKGAIFIGGAEFWRKEPPLLARVRENRYVFVTGARDFNRDLTKKVHRRFRRADVANTKIMVIRKMGHSTPNVEKFREALQYLDEHE